MELKNITDKKEWEEFITSNSSGGFLQSWNWRQFLIKKNYKIHNFFVIEKGQPVAAAQIYKTALPFGKNYYYSPRGPLFKKGLNDSKKIDVVVLISKKLKDGIFWRLDPEDNFNIHRSRIKKSNKEVQPKQTVKVDLSPTEEDVLMNMKSKTRYNIRLADKKGVQVITASNEQDFENFYNLLKKTAGRDEFYLHPRKHYFNLWQTLFPENLKIYLAEYENKIIAGTMVIFYNQEAVYLHGASDYYYRKLMAPYLLQWQAMKDAKKNGCHVYDLWGVAPKTSSKEHPWYGISRFKDGFGGRYEEYMGAYDVVSNSFWYQIFNVVREIKRKIKF